MSCPCRNKSQQPKVARPENKPARVPPQPPRISRQPALPIEIGRRTRP
jgi:hypothetical protein